MEAETYRTPSGENTIFRKLRQNPSLYKTEQNVLMFFDNIQLGRNRMTLKMLLIAKCNQCIDMPP